MVAPAPILSSQRQTHLWHVEECTTLVAGEAALDQDSQTIGDVGSASVGLLQTVVAQAAALQHAAILSRQELDEMA
jgi:hypothetical protein